MNPGYEIDYATGAPAANFGNGSESHFIGFLHQASWWWIPAFAGWRCYEDGRRNLGRGRHYWHSDQGSAKSGFEEAEQNLLVQGYRQVEVARRLIGALFLSVTVHGLLLECLPLWHDHFVEARSQADGTVLSARLLLRSSNSDLPERLAANASVTHIQSQSAGAADKSGNGAQRQVGSGAEKPDVTGIADEHYFDVGNLDVAPQPVHVPALDSKEMLGFPSASGVELLVYVENDGRVSRVDVLAGEHPFSSKAREGFLGALFWPGRVNGLAVPSRVVVSR